MWTEILKGKLTYLGAAGLALYGLYQLSTGDPDAMRTLGEAIGLAGLRRKMEVVDMRTQGAVAGATAALERATGVRQ